MSFVYQIINPETGRKCMVGGQAYKRLVLEGKIPSATLLIVDGKKCIKSDDASLISSHQPKKKFNTRDEKIKALREFKSQKDEVKAKKRKEVKSDEALEIMKQMYIDERKKNKLLKEQVKKTGSAKNTLEESKSRLRAKKEEEHYEVESDDSNALASSRSSSC